jgi:hypothetical protein
LTLLASGVAQAEGEMTADLLAALKDERRAAGLERQRLQELHEEVLALRKFETPHQSQRTR